jgi:hypothetical protein
VDAEALRLNRSRSWVIAWILSDVELFHKEAVHGRSKDVDAGGARVEDVVAGSGDKEGQGAQVRTLEVEVQPKERKPESASRREVVSAKAQPTNCPSCGGMNGMHQRGCRG